MSNYRTLSDGRIWFPVRGNPPDCPAGYQRTSDPFIFEPIIIDCKYRTEKDFYQPCGRMYIKLFCLKYNLFINRGICANCKGIKNEVSSLQENEDKM